MTGRRIHGQSRRSPTYSSWAHYRERTTNPNNKDYWRYKNFGYPPWDDFEVFLADMGVRPAGTTLERVDTTKGYSRGNCVWATMTAQNRNRVNNKLTLADAVRIRSLVAIHARKELARQYGVSKTMIDHIVNGRKWK